MMDDSVVRHITAASLFFSPSVKGGKMEAGKVSLCLFSKKM